MRISWILMILLVLGAALGTATLWAQAQEARGQSSVDVLAMARDDDDGDGDEDDGDEFEEDVALEDLPQVVIDAVVAAVPGLALTSAELEIEAGKTAFCVHGLVDGVELEVEVAPDGTVLEIERD